MRALPSLLKDTCLLPSSNKHKKKDVKLLQAGKTKISVWL